MDLKERSSNANRHPWELSRADMVLRLLPGAGAERYADIGSGDLYFTNRLAETTSLPIYAVDSHYPADLSDARILVRREIAQVPGASVDCAILMDVLEHVDDEAELLEGAGRIVVPGGQLVITVPAHAFLWSEHDRFLEHRRRYGKRQLVGVLEGAGLHVTECFYFYCVPFVLRAVAVGSGRFRTSRQSSSSVSSWSYSSQHPFTRMARTMLNWDVRLLRRLSSLSMPIVGLSLCAICRTSAS